MHYISLFFINRNFENSASFKNNKQELETCRYLVKPTLAVYIDFQKIIFFFWNFDHSLQNLLLNQCLICRSNNDSHQDEIGIYLWCVFEKDLYLNDVDLMTSLQQNVLKFNKHREHLPWCLLFDFTAFLSYLIFLQNNCL